MLATVFWVGGLATLCWSFPLHASPNYLDFLAINHPWAVAIFAKHMLFIIMAGASAYLTWGLLHRLRRAALRRAHYQELPEIQTLYRQESLLILINLILGSLVLALTAIARAL